MQSADCDYPGVPALRLGHSMQVLWQAYEQKNIRRRVYDALNVLMAMNIISKEKKEIRWIGLPSNSAQECQDLEVRSAHGTERNAPPVTPVYALLLQGSLKHYRIGGILEV
jgi:hypothetical protein